jgi:hypothetical protein
MKKNAIVAMAVLFLCGMQGAFSAATNIWTGASGNDLNTATNWNLNAVPASGENMHWDGTQSGDLSLTASGTFGAANGVIFNFLSTQTDSVNINGNGNTLVDFGVFMVESGAGPVTLDNMNFQMTGSATATRNLLFENHSANTLTFGSDLTFTRVGGIAASAGQRNLFFDAGAIHVMGTINNVGNTSYLYARNSGTSLLLDGSVGLRVLVQSGAALGGAGTLALSLGFESGTKLVFDPASTLTVNGPVTFGGFSVADLVNLDSSVAIGSYTLIDGAGTIDFSNVSNIGETFAYSFGGGKAAYFEDDAGALKLTVISAPVTQKTIVYSTDFEGTAGAEIGDATLYSILEPSLYDPSYKAELDGNGRMQANDIANNSNYRVRIDETQTNLYSTIDAIEFTAVLGVPSSNYVGVGFHGGNSAAFVDGGASMNSGPWAAVYADRIVLFGGHGMAGTSNEYAMTYSPGDLVTLELSYYFDTKAVDFSVDGTPLETGLVISHFDMETGLPADANVGWVQINLSNQDTITNGGGYADSLILKTLIGEYAGWAAGWGVDLGAETDDYDEDGLPNLYEYGLGGDPTDAADQGTSPEFSRMTVGGSTVLNYVYPQLSDLHSGLAYSLETCTDLVAGAWTNAGYAVVGTNATDGTLDFVTNTIDVIDDQKFIRLVIE